MKKITPISMTKHFKASDSPDQTIPLETQPPLVLEAVPPQQPPQPTFPQLRPQASQSRQSLQHQSLQGRRQLQHQPLLLSQPMHQPRRSSRASQQTDRLPLSWGTMSYAQVV